ncbi:MAG: hypothetical protein JW709_12635 [Sedimentisphaerales bacterium]|nr:hypothetical protein [Sedimentisphaerales bacterium]
MNRVYRIALIFGFIPLIIGIVIFLLWLATRWDWLMLAGAFTICGGVAAVTLGFLALAYYYWRRMRIPDITPYKLKRKILLCVGLYVLNFLVAGGVFLTAMTIESCCAIFVHNATKHTINNVSISGGGCVEKIISIPPGKTKQCWFWAKHDDEQLTFRATNNTTSYEHTMSCYITNGWGVRIKFTINADESVSATDISD